MHYRAGLFLFLVCFLFPAAARASEPVPEDKSALVILAYSGIGEDSYPDTNLRREQFREHLSELINGEYNVIALPEAVTALRDKKNLPPKAVVITFEGAYQSAFENAMPLLQEHHLPFTVFYASGSADSQNTRYMSWESLKSLSKEENVSLGILPVAYSPLGEMSETEFLRQINNARVRHREKLGRAAQFFSYPFGLYHERHKKAIEQQGFTAAFGLHSGVAYAGSDLYALPRFSMTEKYGDLGRFRLITNALPLPVTDQEPESPQTDSASPSVGFTLAPSLAEYAKELSCFITGQGKAEIQTLGQSRIEIRPNAPFEDGRVRVNCTMPGPSDERNDTPAWRWLGMLFMAAETMEEP